MKKIWSILLCAASLALAQWPARAQDSSRTGAARQLEKTNAGADNLHGKKIQEQSLQKGRFSKLNIPDSAAAQKQPAHKHPRKKRRNRHHL